jgi:hypothetical protein
VVAAPDRFRAKFFANAGRGLALLFFPILDADDVVASFFALKRRILTRGINSGAVALSGKRASERLDGGKLMSSLLGAVTLASTLSGLMLGQITAGAEFAGVIIASLVLMTLRA